MTNKPNPFPCGGPNQPACPPEPTASVYTADEMQAHGQASYQKGRQDLWDSINAVIEEPSHGWSEGEMARAIRAAIQ